MWKNPTKLLIVLIMIMTIAGCINKNNQDNHDSKTVDLQQDNEKNGDTPDSKGESEPSFSDKNYDSLPEEALNMIIPFSYSKEFCELIGNVKNLWRQRYDWDDEEKEYNPAGEGAESIYIFNDAGFLIEYISRVYDSSGKSYDSGSKYILSDRNILLKVINYFDDIKKGTENYFFEWKDNRIIISHDGKRDNGYIQEFKDGKIFRMIELNDINDHDSFREITYYNDTGEIIRKEGPRNSVDFYLNDKKIRSEVQANGEIVYYYYYENDFVEKQTESINNEEEKVLSEYEYVYDSFGNWLTNDIWLYDEDGNKNYNGKIERKIEYYE